MDLGEHLRVFSRKTFKPLLRKWKTRSPIIQPTPRVPIEITVEILEYLWEAYQQTVGNLLFHSQHGSRPFDDDSAKRTLYDARLCLIRCAFVCRAWYEAGVPILYSHCVLLSSGQLSLFRRTLKSSPVLAQTIKELSIVVEQVPSFRLATTSLPAAAKDIIPILQSCTALQSVFLSSPDTVFATSTSPVPALRNLRSVTIHSLGPSSRTFTSNSFEHIEVLCLHFHSIESSVQVPHLPRVHTLKLRSTMWWPNFNPLTTMLPARSLPSLRTLYMHWNGYTIPVTTPNIEFPEIQVVHLIGGKEVQSFATLTQNPTLSALRSLRHLFIGPLTSQDHPLGTWKFPHCFESLTVFMDLDQDASSLEPVLRCLACNEREIQQRRMSLSKVVVNFYWHEYPPTEVEIEERVNVPFAAIQAMGIQLEYATELRLIGE